MLSTCLFFVSSGASAEEGPAKAPHFALAVERVGGVAYTSVKPTGSDGVGLITAGVGGPLINPVALPRVGIDVILSNGLTIGGALGAGYNAASTSPSNGSGTTTSVTDYVLMPRIGYRIGLLPGLDITPRVGVTLLGGTLSVPNNSSNCTSTPTGGTTCTSSTNSDTSTFFAAAASIDVVAALRLTQSFNVLVGAAYDHVFAISASQTSGSGGRSTDAKTDGTYLGAQLWLGLGGYL